MAPRIFFRTALACSNCGTLNDARTIQLSSYLGGDPEWSWVEPGEVLDLPPDDFANEFLVLRAPDGPDITAIELWVCNTCKLYSPARLRFRARTANALEFVGADSLPALTKEILEGANYMTRRIEEWTVRPGEDAARIEDLKRQL